MRHWFDRLESVLKMAAVAIVLMMLLALSAQVFLRYVFGKALSWSEELSLLGFAWVVVISTVIGIRRLTHARMDLVIGLLPKALHRAADGLVAILMSVLGIFIAYAGWNYLIETRGATSAAVGFPIEFLYAAAPAFGVLIALFSLERLLPWAESLNE
jgi:TRAP-type C4-dicarboxylate transport system permease small subunit